MLLDGTCNFFMKKLNASVVDVQNTGVETLKVATIFLQLIQNRYMFRSFTVLQCKHQLLTTRELCWQETHVKCCWMALVIFS